MEQVTLVSGSCGEGETSEVQNKLEDVISNEEGLFKPNVVCTQTDIPEDPDIYRFITGRHVASQTDYLEEYPELRNTDLEILSQKNTDSNDANEYFEEYPKLRNTDLEILSQKDTDSNEYLEEYPKLRNTDLEILSQKNTDSNDANEYFEEYPKLRNTDLEILSQKNTDSNDANEYFEEYPKLRNTDLEILSQKNTDSNEYFEEYSKLQNTEFNHSSQKQIDCTEEVKKYLQLQDIEIDRFNQSETDSTGEVDTFKSLIEEAFSKIKTVNRTSVKSESFKTARGIDKSARDTQKSVQDTEKSARDTEKSAEDTRKSAPDTKKVARDTEKSVEDTRKSAPDTKKVARDTEKSVEDTRKSAPDTKKVAKDTEKAARDTEKAARDTEKSAEDTRKSAPDTKKVAKDTEKAARDTEKSAEDTRKSAQDTRKVAKDAEKAARDTEKSVEDTRKSAPDTKKVARDTEKSAEDTRKSAQDTKKVARDTEKAARDTEKSAEDTRKSAPDTKKVARDTEKAARDNEKSAEDTRKSARDTKKVAKDAKNAARDTKSTQKAVQDSHKFEQDTKNNPKSARCTKNAQKTARDTENAARYTQESARVCNVCGVVVESKIHELQHIRGKPHLDAVKKAEKADNLSLTGSGSSDLKCSLLSREFGFKYIIDVQMDEVNRSIYHPDKNRLKAVQKHAKKLFQKIMDAGQAYEKIEDEHRLKTKEKGDPKLNSKIRKNILELDRLTGKFNNNEGTTALATRMDRLMAEIIKASVESFDNLDNVMSWNATQVGLKVLQCQAVDLPIKSKINACNVIQVFIDTNLHNAFHLLRGTSVCTIMQICAERWNNLIPDDGSVSCSDSSGFGDLSGADPLIDCCLRILFRLMEGVSSPYKGVVSILAQLKDGELEAIKRTVHDVIGYLVATGVVDRMMLYCGGVRGPIDDSLVIADKPSLLQVCLDVLTLMVYTLRLCCGDDARGYNMDKNEQDATRLVAALKSSGLAGIISMTYSILHPEGKPSVSLQDNSDSDGNLPRPGRQATELVKSTLFLMNAFARLDLTALQIILSSKATSIEFRGIASYLLRSVVPFRTENNIRRILKELITLIGHFVVGNEYNQVAINSGQTPTVLELLCDLPQQFFTEKRLKDDLLPTLMAATFDCPENEKVLLEKGIDPMAVENFTSDCDWRGNIIINKLGRLSLLHDLLQLHVEKK